MEGVEVKSRRLLREREKKKKKDIEGRIFRVLFCGGGRGTASRGRRTESREKKSEKRGEGEEKGKGRRDVE